MLIRWYTGTFVRKINCLSFSCFIISSSSEFIEHSSGSASLNRMYRKFYRTSPGFSRKKEGVNLLKARAHALSLTELFEYVETLPGELCVPFDTRLGWAFYRYPPQLRRFFFQVPLLEIRLQSHECLVSRLRVVVYPPSQTSHQSFIREVSFFSSFFTV